MVYRSSAACRPTCTRYLYVERVRISAGGASVFPPALFVHPLIDEVPSIDLRRPLGRHPAIE
jgi:hypothetical protein